MFRVQAVFACEISDGSCNFENAVVAARAEAQLCDGVLHDLFAFGCQHAVLAQVARTHLRIRVDLLVKESTKLDVARGDDTHANRFGGFCSA